MEALQETRGRRQQDGVVEELSVGDLPSGYAFDRYGLMVRRRFGHSGGASPAASDFDSAYEKVWDAVLARDQDAALPSRLDSENSEQASSAEPPPDSCAQ